MPRLALKLMKNHDPHLYRAATAAEVGGLSYVMMTDMLQTNQPPMIRAAIAAAVWYGYSEFVDNLTV
jgi:hypothetical protein